MATILELKIRKRSDVVSIPTAMILAWLKEGEEQAKERFYTFFKPISNENKATVHDKVFLENIINWIPVDEETGRQVGLPLTEQVRWIKLAQKVNAVDGSKPGKIVLANKDIDAIFERIKSPTYKTTGLNEPFIGFLMNLQETTGEWFDDLKPKEEDEDNAEVLELEKALMRETEGSNEHGERIEVSAGS